jgi:hypothetical protein
MDGDFNESMPFSPGESLENWLKRDYDLMTDEYDSPDSNPSPSKKPKLDLERSPASAKDDEYDAELGAGEEDEDEIDEEDQAVHSNDSDEEDDGDDHEEGAEDDGDISEDEFNDDDYSADENDSQFGLPSKPSITNNPSRLTGLPAEQHILGVNDMMSGGIGGSPSLKPRSRSASVDHLVTTSSLDRSTKMPAFRILSREDIVELDLFVGDIPAAFEEDMKITVVGARQALDEVEQVLGGRKEKGYDDFLMGAMMKRIGKFREEDMGKLDEKDKRDLLYAEDLFPVGEELDEEYWGLVTKEAELWEEAGDK